MIPTECFELWRHRVSDARLLDDLTSMVDNAELIYDCFYRDLEFGTGGMRGIMGAGTNRMNIYTVAKATQGYSSYLNKITDHPSVAIGYDSRIHSRLFAEIAAGIFAANEINVYLYDKLTPTPTLSFAVRELGCDGGVVITASHNPKEYNGYKVYGGDGCQITSQAATDIYAEISAIDPFDNIKQIPFEEGLERERIAYINKEILDRYLHEVCRQSVLVPEMLRDIFIAYTPLNGAGISCIPECLRRNGFTNIFIPAEQERPDGDFPTCPYPNPEIGQAYSVAIQCARINDCDLVLVTDPDCDRVGAAVRFGEDFSLINGNQMGILLFDFICRRRLDNQTMPPDPIAVKTIVTTPMAQRLAEFYNVQLINVLTGFKFIGEQIGALEQNGEVERFIFGFEESYGYLSGSYVRDKDAVNASLLICEMFTYYRSTGRTLPDRLRELYEQFGYHDDRLVSIAFEGNAGFHTMRHIMDSLRVSPLKTVHDWSVIETADYKTSKVELANGAIKDIVLPKSNVIGLVMENDSSIVIRPSGTEPKLKLYFFATGNTMAKSKAIIDELADWFKNWIGTSFV